MAKCEVCGNDYDKSFDLIAAGARHTFDSFECAIQGIAPICEHCKVVKRNGVTRVICKRNPKHKQRQG